MNSRSKLSIYLVIAILAGTTVFCAYLPGGDPSAAATLAAAKSTEAAAESIKATALQAMQQFTESAGGPTQPAEQPAGQEVATPLSQEEKPGQPPPVQASATPEILEACPLPGKPFLSTQPLKIWLQNAFFTTRNQGFLLARTLGPTEQPCQLRTQDGGVTWERWNPPTTRLLNSVYFANQSVGWIVGVEGKIFKTQDAGENWSEQNSGRSADLFTIQFWDEKTGWVGGANGTLLWTEDGGSTWNVGATNTTTGIRDMAWVDPKVGYLVAADEGSPISYVLETQDGGRTWQDTGNWAAIPLAIFAAPGQMTWLAGGWVGGAIWRGIGHGSETTVLENVGACGRFRDIYFLDELHGLAVGDCGMALATNDGGKNWLPLDVREKTSWIKIQFFSSQEGILIGSRYPEGYNETSYLIQTEHTRDGGKTWTHNP